MIKYNLIFQAGLVINEVSFSEKVEESKPEPLGLEHFHFPLGLWILGILLSIFFFLAEIIFHRIGR